MSLLGLNLTAQSLQYSIDTPPNSTFVLSRNELEAAVAQAAAQLVWIGKGSSASINLLQHFPVYIHSAYTTQRGELARTVGDLTSAMGWPMPFRISLDYVLMSVRAA
jgi:hypothetical protein